MAAGSASRSVVPVEADELVAAVHLGDPTALHLVALARVVEQHQAELAVGVVPEPLLGRLGELISWRTIFLPLNVRSAPARIAAAAVEHAEEDGVDLVEGRPRRLSLLHHAGDDDAAIFLFGDPQALTASASPAVRPARNWSISASWESAPPVKPNGGLSPLQTVGAGAGVFVGASAATYAATARRARGAARDDRDQKSDAMRNETQWFSLVGERQRGRPVRPPPPVRLRY